MGGARWACRSAIWSRGLRLRWSRICRTRGHSRSSRCGQCAGSPVSRQDRDALGSARARRTRAQQPDGLHGQVRAVRPGEVVEIDSTAMTTPQSHQTAICDKYFETNAHSAVSKYLSHRNSAATRCARMIETCQRRRVSSKLTQFQMESGSLTDRPSPTPCRGDIDSDSIAEWRALSS